MEKNIYRFNGIEVPNLTMAEAVDMARKRVLDQGKTVILRVKNSAGAWITLGTYSPVSPDLWEYRQNPDDNKSPLIPVVCSQPKMDNSKERVIRTIKAVLIPGKTKGYDTYQLVIGGRPDPCNRVFCASEIDGHRTAINDVLSWFKNMKDNGFYPCVKEITFV